MIFLKHRTRLVTCTLCMNAEFNIQRLPQQVRGPGIFLCLIARDLNMGDINDFASALSLRGIGTVNI